MQAFPDLGSVQDTLEQLVDRDLVVRLPRRPGQKEERFAHRLSEDLEDEAPHPGGAVSPPAVSAAPAAVAPSAAAPPPAAPVSSPRPEGQPPQPAGGGRDARLDRLEAALEELRAEPGERLDRLEQRVAALGSAAAQAERLARLERTVAELEAALTALREELGA